MCQFSLEEPALVLADFFESSCLGLLHYAHFVTLGKEPYET